MSSILSRSARRLAPGAALGLLALQAALAGQLEADAGSGDPHALPALASQDTGGQRTTARLVGRILDADGAPAAGAVVVSSAGGKAVTDEDGGFSLQVELPVEAESVQVTAVRSSVTGSEIGSALVSVPANAAAPWPVTAAGTLVLGQASACSPAWLPIFGQHPGVSSTVRAMVAFDDGSGLMLFVAGTFLEAGGVEVNRVARWNGTTWSQAGTGTDNDVYALVIHDDGSGPALYAAGAFVFANDDYVSRVARWNGSSWTALGSGVDQNVYALAVFDDGSGAALYAGGDFTTAGGFEAKHIARWNGSAWSPLKGGTNNRVEALAVFDDGSGPALYAGGVFTSADHKPANRIARWDGTNWSALGSGLNAPVYSLAAFEDGSGPALCAGGAFTMAGAAAASRVARWSGSQWSALGSGMNNAVQVLAVLDEGSGPALYAGGGFTLAGGVLVDDVAKWTGGGWSAAAGGTSGEVRSLASADFGGGPALYAGGQFSSAGGLLVNNVSRWSGTAWSVMGDGLNSYVLALAAFDDGSGPALYAGGVFTMVGDVPVKRVARWDGMNWSALGSGLNGTVFGLAVFDDGSGPALCAGGDFTTAGGLDAEHIARWNGSSWSSLQDGTNGRVEALAVFDDGAGAALYAGGRFTLAGGVAAEHVARWDGASWSALGAGVFGTTGPFLLPISVSALAAFDDGSGPALYAGGFFKTAGNVTANSIARWTGAEWSALGSGVMDLPVASLAVFDDGSGPALFMGGRFAVVDGVQVNRIAKWDGGTWSMLGSGVSGGFTLFPTAVDALAAFDDGSGPALYAGGAFTTAGGVAASRIAKWNGATWSPLGTGVSEHVAALGVYYFGSGSYLFAGGHFGATPGSTDSYLAQWGGCPAPVAPWTDLGFALPGIAGGPLLVGTGPLTEASAGTLELSHAAPSALAMLYLALAGTPSPFQCGTLVPVPVLASLPLDTSPAGEVALGWSSWPAGLSGLQLFFQCAIQDAAAPCGVALSHALRADVP
jgi:trimeric autotransporter adhesin